MTWSGKPVLVTGAGGFIASHLAERLVEAGARVRAFVHYNGAGRRGWLDDSALAAQMDIVAGDICDRDSVVSAVRGVEVVFHLAALIAIPYSYQAPASYVRTNVEGTLNVLQAARDAGVGRVVHTSTSEVYGTARYVPIDEGHPLQGQSPYSASKIGADKIAESFQHAFGVPVVTVRPFNAYGPRQSARAVIPTIATQCLTGAVVKLGNLTPTRDLTFVRDTAEGFVRAAESARAIGRTVNLGTGTEIAVGALAMKIAGMLGRTVTVETEAARVRPAGSEVDRLCADTKLARDLLGWYPAHTLDAGLRVTLDWIRDHLDRYRPNVYAV